MTDLLLMLASKRTCPWCSPRDTPRRDRWVNATARLLPRRLLIATLRWDGLVGRTAMRCHDAGLHA